uniref:Replication factor C subunit 1 n=1 Tax=Anthurium amnicola TaxID=1678845 RepID=A0A1D1YZI7_9ARAE
MSDIRKWFMKQHDKGNGSVSKSEKTAAPAPQPQKPVDAAKEESGRRKTSKYFVAAVQEPASKPKPKGETTIEKTPSKRKAHKAKEESDEETRPPSAKKVHKDDDEDFVLPSAKKKSPGMRSTTRLKSEPDTGIVKNHASLDEDEEDLGDKDVSSPKARGRGRGGRGPGTAASSGRGRGGGRGGFMNFGERKDPPHKGEKEVPEGAPDCLAGLTFVISGTLDSLEREEAEDLIKRHGGRVTGSVSKKTNFLLAEEDIGGRKATKAKELGTAFLTEDGLFDMIRKSKPGRASVLEESKKKTSERLDKVLPKSSPMKVEEKGDQFGKSLTTKSDARTSVSRVSKKREASYGSLVMWTEKYKPKVPNDIIGNQSLVKQLHDWLNHWDEHFLHSGQKGKGKRQNDAVSKKAVLMSGSPGIGKTTSAKLVSQMLGFQAIEVNASDNRGKADTKIFKGIGGCTANSIKELISNEALNVSKDWSKSPKAVLIMDEVDGMSAGDRGGVADLIASIKISKIPIICICNDRYSQKLKSLVNYCLPLNFRKPTKQQMAKRLLQIANAEGIQVNEIALEELADRVNGDMRMAINQLQYMSLSLSVIKYDDVRDRLLISAKDEDISPFTAVDKLFGFNGGKLRMDERIDLSMSDLDLVPLIIQENYINYRPIAAGKDDNGVKRMNLLAHAAESIGDGDIVNVQIRRYRQWQLSQAGSVSSCIIPASLMHGHRETLEQGERNYNRFGGWLGKNSTMGKNLRLLENVHVHVIASQQSSLDREALRVDYFSLLLKQLTQPLRLSPKDDAVQKVVDFMDAYSLSQEDFDSIVELSKFQGHPNALEGVQPAVKAALTKAYKKGSNSRVIRVADLISLPGVKKAPKKRIAAMLEPVDNGMPEENGEVLLESEEETSSDADIDADTTGEPKLQLDLQSNKSKGIQVQLDLKDSASSKKTSSKLRGSESAEKVGRGSRGGKRKR